MGVEKSVADRANDPSEQSKSGVGRRNINKKKTNPSTQREEGPKG